MNPKIYVPLQGRASWVYPENWRIGIAVPI